MWDKQNDILYVGGITASLFENTGGWAGISPLGDYVIVNGDWSHMSYKINHTTQTLDTDGVLFWTLCGGHGDIISASNGKTYEITSNCYDAPEVYLVDVSSPKFPAGTFFTSAPKLTPEQIADQKSGNVKLFELNWSDAMHFSCAETSDWCYVSVESEDDNFNSPGAPRLYKSEIIRVLVVAPYTIEHLAHHLSKGRTYNASVRVNASPSGERAMFASDFGYDNGQQFGYSDIYVLELGKKPSVSLFRRFLQFFYSLI